MWYDHSRVCSCRFPGRRAAHIYYVENMDPQKDEAVSSTTIIIIIIIIIIITNQGGKVTILWNQQVQTDRTIPNNKPDIIIRDNENRTCMLIDVAIPADRNVIKK